MDADSHTLLAERGTESVPDRAADRPLDEFARLLASVAELDLAGRYGFADLALPLGRVLDAGCGDGHGAAILARRGRDVIAIDHATSAYAPPDIRITRADLAALDADDGCFAGIACLDVLDETDRTNLIVSELRRTLARDGALVVSLRQSRAGAGPAEDSIRDAFPHVRQVEGGLVLSWRVESHASLTDRPPSSNGASSTAAQARRLLIASSVPVAETTGTFLCGPALDADLLQADWTEAVQAMRGLHVDLHAARDDLRQVTELRNLLVSAEQEAARLPDLRNMLRTLVAERDELRDLLRRAVRRRPYPQLGIIMEALREAGLTIDDDAREALHAVLSEFDRREDLRKAFSHAGQLRLGDLLQWAMTSPDDDAGILLVRRHRPVLTLIWDALGGDRAIVVPVTST